jgi:Fic family protein
MSRYIYQHPDWPKFDWDKEGLAAQLASVRHRQGRLLGRMESLGFPQRDEALLQTFTLDVLKSSEIEGEILSASQVRSSIARRLGMDIAGLVPSDRHVDGVVAMVLEATRNYSKPLTEARLLGWHRSLFPDQEDKAFKIRTGAWRDDAKGPMQVVSGPLGRERVHYEAPAAERIPAEMSAFLDSANKTEDMDLVLKAGVAHLWFVTIHPFDDGNGRIARAIADWALTRSEKTSQRYYSMSAQIGKERKAYYNILEKTQKSSLEITEWMQWFLGCLDRAIEGTEDSLAAVFKKDSFWKTHAGMSLNERQRSMLNKMLDGLEGKLTSTKWATLAKCSQDSAQRDIVDLIEKGILVKDSAGGRSTSYSMKAMATGREQS